MTTLDGTMMAGPVKDELYERMGMLPSQSMMAATKPRRSQTISKPVEDYRYWVALVVLDDGTIQSRSSAELKPYKRMILESASPKLGEILVDYVGPTHSATSRPRSVNQPMPFGARDASFPGYPRKPGKRRRQESYHGIDQDLLYCPEQKSEAKQPAPSARQIQIRVDDRKAQAKWFSDAFKAVQQVGCRTIAKVWIKKIHPKKQSTHPYNGMFPRDQPADANRTRPPYWPSGVIHKEPDHIDRNARTALLVHLIMHTPQPQIKYPQDGDSLITARDMFLALEEKRNDFKPDRWNIITEIINAREHIEMFENGSFDPDTIVHVPDFSDSARSSRDDGDGGGDDNDLPPSGPVSASGMDDDYSQEDKPDMSLPSPATSPAGFGRTDPSELQQVSRSGEGNGKLSDTTSATDAPTSYPSGVNNFMNTSSGQECGAEMTIDTHAFDDSHKHDRSVHQLQQLRLPHDLNGFQAINRQHEEMMANHWLTHESPTTYLPQDYGMGNMHSQQHVSPSNFRMSGGDVSQEDLQQLGMAHELPLLEGVSYEDYPPHSRVMPTRTMSTPHHLLLDHSVHDGHGLGVSQSTFYSA